VETNNEGVYAIGPLRPGLYALRAVAAGHYPAWRRARVFSGEMTRVSFALVPRLPGEAGAIDGFVRDVGGAPLPHAAVFYLRLEPDEPEPLMLESPDPDMPHVLTNGDGTYRIEDLRPGRYLLVTRAHDHAPARAVAGVEPGQTTRVNFFLEPFPPVEPGAIEGLVRDAATSVPIAGAHVYFMPLPPELDANLLSRRDLIERLPQVRTNEEGHYLIPRLRPSPYRLIVLKPGYHPATAVVGVEPGHTTRQDFALDAIIPPAPGAIEGTVLETETFEPMPGSLVFFFPVEPDAPIPPWVLGVESQGPSNALPAVQLPAVQVGPDGHYRIADLHPGFYLLVAVAPGHFAEHQVVGVASGGVSQANFFLRPIGPPPHGAIEGHVQDALTSAPIAGAWVFFLPATPGAADPAVMDHPTASVPFVRTNNEGNFRIAPLRPGRYVLVVLAEHYFPAREHFLVEAGQTTAVLFELQPFHPPDPGSIAGVVTNADTGEPIRGASVYFGPVSAGSDPALGSVHSDGLPPGVVYTSFEGKYVIEGLPPGYYHLAVFKEGFEWNHRRVLVESGQRSHANFRLVPLVPAPGAIEGVVRDRETSGPLAGARVYYRVIPPNPIVLDERVAIGADAPATDTLNDLPYVETGADGHYRIAPLRPGLYQLEVVVRGYWPAHRRVGVEPDRTSVANFALAPREGNLGAIRGRVVDALTSDPLAHTHLWVVPDGPITIQSLMPAVVYGEAWTNEQGEYFIANLPAVQVQVYAAHEGYRGQRKLAQVPPGGVTRVNFALQPIPQTLLGHLVGRVINNADGRPIAEAVVELVPDAPVDNALSIRPNLALIALTGPDGHYAFHQLPAGLYHARVSKPHFQPARDDIMIPPGQTVEKNWRLMPEFPPPPGAILGRVVDALTSEPIAGAWVGLDGASAEADSTPLQRWTLTNEHGEYRFGTVPPRPHTLRVVKHGYQPAEREVEVHSGQTTVANFRLQPVLATGVIEGTVRDALSGEPLPGSLVFVPLVNAPQATSPSNAIFDWTDDHGHYRLADVPAGRRIVVAFHRRYWPDAQQALVPAGGGVELDFALLPRPSFTRTWRVRVQDVHGAPVPGAIVRALVVPWIDPDCEWNPWRGATDPTGDGILNEVPIDGCPLVVTAPGYLAQTVALATTTAAGDAAAAEAEPTITVTLEAAPHFTAAGDWTLYR
jgi:protocatechuate 3,4-dioxygenase beta subunit